MKTVSTGAVLLLVVVLLAGCTGLSDDGPGPDGVLNDSTNDSEPDENGSSTTDGTVDGTTDGTTNGSTDGTSNGKMDGTTNDSESETPSDGATSGTSSGTTNDSEDSDGAAGKDDPAGTTDEETASDDGRAWLTGKIQGIESTNTYRVELDNGSSRTFRVADVQVLPRDTDPDLSAWSHHLSGAEQSCVELQQDKAWEFASELRFEDVNLTPVSDRRYVVYDEDGNDVAAQLLYDGLARVTDQDSRFTERYREAQDRATAEQKGIWRCADETIIFD